MYHSSGENRREKQLFLFEKCIQNFTGIDFSILSPIQIETVETMHYSLPTSGGDDDDDQAGNSNVLAQMLLGAAQPNLLENLSRFNLLKGMAGQSTQPNLGFKSKSFDLKNSSNLTSQ